VSKRPAVPTAIAEAILTACVRRCCLCAALSGDFAERRGQIVHLDHDPTNNRLSNLAFLCFDHHDQYDSRTSQAKGMTAGEVKNHLATLLERIASGALDAKAAAPASTAANVTAAVYLGPGAVQVSGSGNVQITGPNAINITQVGSAASSPSRSTPSKEESLVERAARIRQEDEDDRNRQEMLRVKGTEMAAREAVRVLDAMAQNAEATGVAVERRGQESKAGFFLAGLTMGVEWRPPAFLNEVGGRLAVTLWGPPSAKMTSRYLPTLSSRTFSFDITPKTHEPQWRPTRGVDQPISTADLADLAIRLLFDQIEKTRNRR
jgi:hypothetical protein